MKPNTRMGYVDAFGMATPTLTHPTINSAQLLTVEADIIERCRCTRF